MTKSKTPRKDCVPGCGFVWLAGTCSMKEYISFSSCKPCYIILLITLIADPYQKEPIFFYYFFLE